MANAGTDTLNKYGNIVNYPRGALSNDEYRALILVKIAVDDSTADGNSLLNIVQAVGAGPYHAWDLDNFGFGAALDLQSGYTPFALGLILLLPHARGGGNYVTLRYWTWSVATYGLWVLGDSTGSPVGATGLGDAVSSTLFNALAAVAVV